jgi:hypothetical protein
MTKTLAALIYATWAAQYDPEADAVSVEAANLVIAEKIPHIFPPLVPETFRGPKWGTR